jgi:hypothetical protein
MKFAEAASVMCFFLLLLGICVLNGREIKKLQQRIGTLEKNQIEIHVSTNLDKAIYAK